MISILKGRSDVLVVVNESELLEIVHGYIQRSVYYQKRYDNRLIRKFSDIPFMSKVDLIADQKTMPPFGSNLAVPLEALKRIHRTSGTSTTPYLIGVTQKDIEAVVASGRKAMLLAGMGPGDIVVNCMNYCMWMGGFMDHLSMEATGATLIPYGVGNTENLLKLLLEIRGASIHATPSYLDVMKKILKERFSLHPRELGLKKGFFGGESGMQDPIFRKRIEAEWGLHAVNANYGLSEVISILGSECTRRDGLHFTATPYLHVELVSINGTQCLPIEQGTVGELTVTHLQKEAQPLIRYRTGDIIEIIDNNPCLCGESSFRFRVTGRKDDMLVIKGINFYPESLRSILAKYPECSGAYQVQIPSTTPIVEFKVLIKTRDNCNDINLKEQLLKDIHENLFVTPIVELVSEIEMHGNKAKLVEVI